MTCGRMCRTTRRFLCESLMKSADRISYFTTSDGVRIAHRMDGDDSKPVLLDFGASWCPDCVALAHTFTAPTVQPLVAGFHLVEIDVGKFDRNTDLAAKYGIDYQHSGIPALVVLSPQGEVRTTTEDGSFADASRMTPAQVATFLRRWQH